MTVKYLHVNHLILCDTNSGHQVHGEHAMSASRGSGKQSSLTSNDDPSYEDYVDEVENMRNRNKGSNSQYDINKVLSHLGLPEYEYVDAQNYDYLLANTFNIRKRSNC